MSIRKIRKVTKMHLWRSDLRKAMPSENVDWVVVGRTDEPQWHYLGWIKRAPLNGHVYYDAFAMPPDYEVNYYNETPPVGIPVTNADRCAKAVEMLVRHFEVG